MDVFCCGCEKMSVPIINPRAILPTGTITACNENKVRHLQVLIHCVVEKAIVLNRAL